MFDDPGCVWCRRWNAEIGPGYPRSPEGQQAPLRRIHIRDQAKAGVALARPINATPTFVLVEDGRGGRPDRRICRERLLLSACWMSCCGSFPSPAPLPGPAAEVHHVLCAAACRP